MASYPPRKRRRANGEGSIYPYRGGWRGALTWTDSQGTLRRRVTSGKSQADVRRALAELRSNVDAGVVPAPSLDLASYLARWLEASRQRVRPSTWRAYQQ